jgi:hypothetical protein
VLRRIDTDSSKCGSPLSSSIASLVPPKNTADLLYDYLHTYHYSKTWPKFTVSVCLFSFLA